MSEWYIDNIPYQVRQLGTTSAHYFWNSVYARLGVWVDMWADTLPGRRKQSSEFVSGLSERLGWYLPETAVPSLEHMPGSGFAVEGRQMIFLRQPPVNLTIYVAGVGPEDLYVSWRAFYQGGLARWKIVFLVGVILVLVLSVVLSFGPPAPFPGGQAIRTNAQVLLFAAAVLGPVLLVGVLGFIFRQGDYLGFLRKPLTEIYADDLVALSGVVHRAIIETADQMGVDTAKLIAHEPFYKERRRPRI